MGDSIALNSWIAPKNASIQHTRACVAAATPEALEAAQPLDECIFTENQCESRDSDCAIENCGDLLTACVGEPECGNGRREAGESCDDGNRRDGDECPADCQSVQQAVCGDGRLDAGEGCDDGTPCPMTVAMLAVESAPS